MLARHSLALALVLTFASNLHAEPAKPPPAKTEVTWYGQAAFRIKTPKGRVILIDPWIVNPVNKNGKDDLAKLGNVDLILISHGHQDHVGDAIEIAKKTKAKLVASNDLAAAIVGVLGYPKDQAGMDTVGNSGGTVTLLDGEVSITFTPAVHSSAVAKGEGSVAAGNPGGFVIAVQGGPTFYHTGDTDLFSDMALIGKFAKIDVMLACIGDHFTMGPERAAEAARLVGAKIIVPMHFATFPLLTGTPEALAAALKKGKVKTKMQVLEIGKPVEM